VRRRRRGPRPRRVVLRRCDSEAEAAIWAGAFRAVLAALGIADWWRVRIDPADAGAHLVGVDYEPRETLPW
jgi:hypothetical protein